jgi:tetratricopeptide (TPR) repeat protein
MSQFYPSTRQVELQRSMGLLSPEEEPSDHTELRNYLTFVETEPDSPLGYAAAAHWHQSRGYPEKALEILDRAASRWGGEPREPFWLAARIASLIDLGRGESADASFQLWPEPLEGYDYWRMRAMVLDEARGDYENALAAYDRATTTWPGPIDWRLWNRKASCLTHAGRADEANQTRATAKLLEELSREEIHRALRARLMDPNHPATIKAMADFYRQLGRSREADLWAVQPDP